MNLLTSVKIFNNSKLYFSNNELSKIFACYFLGVARGSWKDYAITFEKQEASFYMYKHSLGTPDCVLTKSKKLKKNIILYNLKIANIKKYKYSKIDDLIATLRRKEFVLI